jgi:hypothetical protein
MVPLDGPFQNWFRQFDRYLTAAGRLLDVAPRIRGLGPIVLRDFRPGLERVLGTLEHRRTGIRDRARGASDLTALEKLLGSEVVAVDSGELGGAGAVELMQLRAQLESLTPVERPTVGALSVGAEPLAALDRLHRLAATSPALSGRVRALRDNVVALIGSMDRMGRELDRAAATDVHDFRRDLGALVADARTNVERRYRGAIAGQVERMTSAVRSIADRSRAVREQIDLDTRQARLAVDRARQNLERLRTEGVASIERLDRPEKIHEYLDGWRHQVGDLPTPDLGSGFGRDDVVRSIEGRISGLRDAPFPRHRGSLDVVRHAATLNVGGAIGGLLEDYGRIEQEMDGRYRQGLTGVIDELDVHLREQVPLADFVQRQAEIGLAELIEERAARHLSMFSFGSREDAVAKRDAEQQRFAELLAEFARLVSVAEQRTGWLEPYPVVMQILDLSIVYSWTGPEQDREAMREILRCLRAALAERRLSPDQFCTLLVESLDAFAHRFDAWFSGECAGRLAQQRRWALPPGHEISGAFVTDEDPGRNCYGVYGWLENPVREIGPAAERHYLQAPSIDHAKTAAILRAGAMSEERAFQIDLSSERVQAALWLLRGLQAGTSIPELLGRRAERLLHDAGSGWLIEVLRAGFPRAGTASAASRRLDGEAFAAASEAALAALAVTTGGGVRKLTSDEHRLLVEIQAAIASLKDAFADVAVAETLYQHVRGNDARVRAWMEAVEGKAAPPDPEVVRTPRTAQNKIQRVIVPIGFAEPIASAGDPGALSSLRAIAEPALAALAATVLERPHTAVVTVRPSGGGTAIETYEIDVARDWRLSPIDEIFADDDELRERAAIHWLERIARDHVAAYDALGAAATGPALLERVALDFTWRTPAAEAARGLLRSAAVLRPEQVDKAALDPVRFRRDRGRALACYRGRLECLGRRLGALRDRLGAGILVEGGAGQSLLAELRAAGFADVIAAHRRGDRQGLRDRLAERIAAIERAVDAAGALDIAVAGWDQLDHAIDAAVRALRAACSTPDLPVALPFELDTAGASEIEAGAIDPARALRDVREPLRRLCELFGGFTYRRRIGWLLDRDEALETATPPGKPLPTTATPTQAEWRQSDIDLHVYADGPDDPLRAGLHIAGLVDEWIDASPNPTEQTALALRYEALRAEAPNAILLCVPDDGQPAWQPTQLARCLANVVDLAQIRTLTTDELAAAPNSGSPLPCLDYRLEVSAADETYFADAPPSFATTSEGLASRHTVAPTGAHYYVP